MNALTREAKFLEDGEEKLGNWLKRNKDAKGERLALLRALPCGFGTCVWYQSYQKYHEARAAARSERRKRESVRKRERNATLRNELPMDRGRLGKKKLHKKSDTEDRGKRRENKSL